MQSIGIMSIVAEGVWNNNSRKSNRYTQLAVIKAMHFRGFKSPNEEFEETMPCFAGIVDVGQKSGASLGTLPRYDLMPSTRLSLPTSNQCRLECHIHHCGAPNPSLCRPIPKTATIQHDIENVGFNVRRARHWLRPGG
jgi:hypothetical protein